MKHNKDEPGELDEEKFGKMKHEAHMKSIISRS